MKPLQQILAEADPQKVAIRHFNISDLVALMEAPHTRRNPRHLRNGQLSQRDTYSPGYGPSPQPFAAARRCSSANYQMRRALGSACFDSKLSHLINQR